MKLTILGVPRTKKTSQRIARNRKTGAPFVLQSKQSVAWAKTAVWQIANQWRGRKPIASAAWVRATFYRERATGDLVNFLQALADALEAAGVVENDRLITSWDGSRLDKDAARPRVELEIFEMAREESNGK